LAMKPSWRWVEALIVASDGLVVTEHDPNTPLRTGNGSPPASFQGKRRDSAGNRQGLFRGAEAMGGGSPHSRDPIGSGLTPVGATPTPRIDRFSTLPTPV